MNGLQALHQWRDFMNTPTGVWLGFINAIYWAGTGITYLTMPWISNRYGRKLGVYMGYGFLALGVGLCGADNETGFILSRFFVGCASACFAATVPLLINEIAYPTHRGIANALFMCGWYVGGTIAAFIVSGTSIGFTYPNDLLTFESCGRHSVPVTWKATLPGASQQSYKS
jgi:MFS family permease